MWRFVPSFDAPPLARAQHSVRLPHALALSHEFLRRGGVELEHLVMAGDRELCADVLGDPHGFSAVEIPGDAALRAVAIDRQQRDVDVERPELLHHPVKQHRVTTMVNVPAASLYDVAHESVAPLLVDVALLVRSGHAVDL